MNKKRKTNLADRNFRSAQEEAAKLKTPSRYAGPESSYRLAFTDTAFLLQDDLRPVRMQRELLKPEMVQRQYGVEATIVIFGSARIAPPDLAQNQLRACERFNFRDELNASRHPCAADGRDESIRAAVRLLGRAWR